MAQSAASAMANRSIFTFAAAALLLLPEMSYGFICTSSLYNSHPCSGTMPLRSFTFRAGFHCRQMSSKPTSLSRNWNKDRRILTTMQSERSPGE